MKDKRTNNKTNRYKRGYKQMSVYGRMTKDRDAFGKDTGMDFTYGMRMKRHQLDLHWRIKQNYLSVLDKTILSFSGDYVVAREMLDDYVYRLSSEKENGNK